MFIFKCNDNQALVIEDSKFHHSYHEFSDPADLQVGYNLKKLTDRKNLQEIEDPFLKELGIEGNPSQL